jgi:phosphoglycerate dehydrogenase-like enzyme
MAKPEVLVLPQVGRRELILPPRVERMLARAVRVRRCPEGALSEEQFIELLAGCQGCMIGWGSPRFTDNVVAHAPDLRIIAHSAGSVKPYISDAVFDRGIVVTSAASAIATSVAEHCLGLAIALLRDYVPRQKATKDGRIFYETPGMTNLGLFGRRVGIIGFGCTGREFARLLMPFRPDAVVYDPHLDQAAAKRLRVRGTTFEDALASSVVALHAPNIDENRGIINSDTLRLLPDGAVLINTARGLLIDHDALLGELRSGRIKAALDVTSPEPLPPDHPLRELPNIILTPHIAGPTSDRLWTLGDCAARDLARFFTGKAPLHVVTRESLAYRA